MQRLLDVDRLPVALVSAAGATCVTFAVVLVSSFNELGGGNPLWMNLLSWAVVCASGLLILWASVLLLKWMVLKVGNR